MNYDTFMASKHIRPTATGFDVKTTDLNPILFDWQRKTVQWALRLGRAALFEECGLGKTFQQMEWLRQVANHTGRKALNIVPLAVAYQAIEEAAKLGIEAKYCRNQAEAEAAQARIIVTNYDMIESFNPDYFAGVSLDESSILKSFTGMTKRLLLDMFKNTPYRLANTATPAPNDMMELGNHADFLGIMPSNEMIMRWFVNDTMKAGGYRLKKQAEKDYWRWVASWAVCLSSPADIGYSAEGYDLKPLNLHEHVVSVDHTRAHWHGRLLVDGTLSATAMWAERKATTADRCRALAEIVQSSPNEYWSLWCETDAEADLLQALLPSAIEVRGSHKREIKEARLKAFSHGEAKIIITKPEIAGFGLNWQHCNHMGFVGVSYSFEKTYQALRRAWRFGQTKPVEAHLVYAESEGGIRSSLLAKQKAHNDMQKAMSEAMRENGFGIAATPQIKNYHPNKPMELPNWLYTHQ